MKKGILFTILFSIVLHSGFGMYVQIQTSNAACGMSNGGAVVYVSGGTEPYTYLWSTGATTQVIQNVDSGTYALTVHDAVGDSVNRGVYIGDRALDNVIILAVPATTFACDNLCTGSFQINEVNLRGTPPYSFLSDHGFVNMNYPSPGLTTVGGLCGGDLVTVTVTDNIGCVGTQTQEMIAPPPPNASFTITPSCNSLANGSVTVNSVAQWSFDINMAITTDTTNLAIVDGTEPGVISFSQYAPFTTNNLLPGDYYLNISYQFTDYIYPYYGCTKYIHFTVPDLGTNCGNVQGNVFLDFDADCVADVNDVAIPNTLFEFTPGPFYAYTNSSGHYYANLPWGNYNLVQHVPSLFSQLCPAGLSPIVLSSGNPAVTVNFADTSVLQFDISSNIGNSTARPGFNFTYGIQVRNLSYDTSGVVTVTMNYDPMLSFVSANPVPLSTSPGQVIWEVNQMNAFATAAMSAMFNVPANPNLIGDTLIASVSAVATTFETNFLDNIDTVSHIIRGSFDPNAKYVDPEGSFLPPTNKELTYKIEFQNTGTDTAFNIEVVDTLDSNLDVASFVPLASSFPYTTEITGHGVIHFHFLNINLPDSVVDEVNSHGFVSFSIHAKPNLSDGTIISNKADIIFDFNPPIETNRTINTVAFATNIQLRGDNHVSVFPNPTKGIFYLSLQNDYCAKDVFVTDILGNAVIEKRNVKESRLEFDLRSFSKGVYFIKTVEGGKMNVVKVIYM